MPEYLAPGVYVEERDSGAKAIEGVSTTTTGMVGITERGPEGVPTLVIGVADFTRQFGGLLDRRIYTAANWYLPLVVEGFFINGGQHDYIVRVLPVEATAASATLFDRGAAGGVDTSLAAAVSAGDAALFVTDAAGLTAGKWLKVDDEEKTEYVEVKSTSPTLFAARTGLRFAHAKGAKATKGSVTPGATDALTVDVAPGDTAITTTALAPPVDAIVEVGSGPTREYGVVLSAAGGVVTFRHALRNVHDGTGTPETVTVVTFTPDTATKLAADAAVDAPLFQVEDGTNFTDDDVVELLGAANETEYRVIDPALFLRLGSALEKAHAAGKTVKVAVPVAAGKLTAATVAGSKDIELDFVAVAGDVLQIGAGDEIEIAVVDSVNGNTATLLTEPKPHALDTAVRSAAAASFGGTAVLAGAVASGEMILTLHDLANATNYDENDIVEIDGGGADTEYLPVAGLANAISIAPPLQSLHAADTKLVERAPLLMVQAVDRGGWGNELYVDTADDTPIVDTFANDDADINTFALQLRTTVGVEAGTILEIGYVPATATTPAVAGKLHKVAKVTSKGVELATPLTVAVTKGEKVRSREFLISARLSQINPKTNKRRVVESEAFRQLSLDDRHSRYAPKVIGRIFFDGLKTPKEADGRTSGESELIRVEDILLDANGNLPATAQTTLRLGPDLIVDTLPDGREVTVATRLSGGDDSIATVTDDTYIGNDDLDPKLRTGLQALKNIDEISIVAIPGRTTQKVQQALIDHCELLRYRFAVLDARPKETIAGVQEQRSLYDTKYAALYHPWLLIEDPFPDNPRVGGQIAIPPSGHVIGIYARSDIERGVHKAPANEVVRGIANVEVSLAKAHQDILNPIGIDVIRNFRDANRGLRVWGARTLSSDPDWKYVNVRRLFIFLEASIDRGTQWVVFEPNSELLWQRVIRTITGFLLGVWRDGALMGTKPEEAFFVKCDRTTMTQNDIDNGRLIVLIGVAPVKPAEFVIFRIGQFTASAE